MLNMWNMLKNACVLAGGLMMGCAYAEGPTTQPASRPTVIEWQSLFDGKTLAGWHEVGGGKWSVEDGDLVGQKGDGRYGWLVTDRPYDDFILEFECKHEVPGNSGIQFRSHVVDDTMYGYQAEFDPRQDHGTGGLYEEKGRGWLHKPDAQGLAAMKRLQWNRYRIQAIGDHLQISVNDVITTDLHDTQARGGIIALQVHSGTADMKIRWRHLRIQDLGDGCGWTPLFDGKSLTGWHTQGNPADWRVEDGEIVGELPKPAPYSYLMTDANYRDFEIKVNFLYESNDGNSGVFFRSIFPPQCTKCNEVIRTLPENPTAFKCPKCGSDQALPYKDRVHIHGVQAEVALPNQNTGAIYDTRAGQWIAGTLTDFQQKMHRFHKWNELRIIAKGRDATVYLNGYRTYEIKDYDFPADGHIALQLHSGGAMKIRFKNLLLRPLGDLKSAQADNQ